jgi:hypothetical protein
VEIESGHGRTFLVEHYRPGVTIAGFARDTGRVQASAEALSGANGPIALLHSTLVPEDETGFCLFSAASRALVEEAYRSAGVSFERIVEALELRRDPIAGTAVEVVR